MQPCCALNRRDAPSICRMTWAQPLRWAPCNAVQAAAPSVGLVSCFVISFLLGCVHLQSFRDIQGRAKDSKAMFAMKTSVKRMDKLSV